MAFQNLADPSDITLRHFAGELTDGNSINVTNNSTTQTWLIKSCILSNYDDQYDGDVQVRVTLVYPNNAIGFDLCRNVWIPYGTNLTIINDNLPIYLDYDYRLKINNLQGIKMGYNVSIATITG